MAAGNWTKLCADCIENNAQCIKCAKIQANIPCIYTFISKLEAGIAHKLSYIFMYIQSFILHIQMSIHQKTEGKFLGRFEGKNRRMAEKQAN